MRDVTGQPKRRFRNKRSLSPIPDILDLDDCIWGGKEQNKDMHYTESISIVVVLIINHLKIENLLLSARA